MFQGSSYESSAPYSALCVNTLHSLTTWAVNFLYTLLQTTGCRNDVEFGERGLFWGKRCVVCVELYGGVGDRYVAPTVCRARTRIVMISYLLAHERSTSIRNMRVVDGRERSLATVLVAAMDGSIQGGNVTTRRRRAAPRRQKPRRNSGIMCQRITRPESVPRPLKPADNPPLTKPVRAPSANSRRVPASQQRGAADECTYISLILVNIRIEAFQY
eukprot:359493-Pleurochrysis_carterae.AAC.2